MPHYPALSVRMSQCLSVIQTAIKMLIAAILPLSAASCSMSDDDQPGEDIVKVGDNIPYFEITMNDGTQFVSTQLGGKPCVVIFFNTTCIDCQRELPALNQRYQQNGHDTTFVAIARDQADPEIQDYWHTHNLTLPYSPQPNRTIYNLFATRGIPRTYIVNTKGKIVSKN